MLGRGELVTARCELPAPALVDLDHDGLVALGIERGDDRARRRDRDVVLARAAAGENRHANA